MSNEKTRGHDRTRNWSFIVYPESAPNNWRDMLDDGHLQWIESPLHDKDTDGDGEIKKPHWHILVLYDGVKSYEQVKELTDKINAPIPQKAASARGLVRYMVHMDNPEKFQYNKSLIIGHGGADVTEYLKPTSSSRYQLIGEMMDFVRDSEITEISELHDYARVKRFDDWFPLLCDNSGYIMEQYIKSRRHAFYADKEERRKNTNAKELKNIATPPI